jgi:acyl-coenzyme A thioesterase PaaI-like protein
VSAGPGRPGDRARRRGRAGHLIHHELCFGCGRTNLFGILLDVAPVGPDSVAGRCFIKQDHQGADRGGAHDGVVAAALSEAMALACGLDARLVTLELSVRASAPVGAFLEVQARVERREGAVAEASATATADQRMVAQARGSFRI